MNRREALSRVALIMGGTVLGAEAFLSGCTTGTTGLKFSQDDISFLNEVAETILPATNTPGAKEAKVGEFMTVIVKDCYEAKDQTAFRDGMTKLDDACKAKHKHGFMKASAAWGMVFWSNSIALHVTLLPFGQLNVASRNPSPAGLS